jgi:hypothetical protein
MFHLLSVSMSGVTLPYLEISGVRKWGMGSARYEADTCFMIGEVDKKYQSQIQRPLEH